MIFILRNLRRLELHKRSGRYFLYAIGEIVLVVVGILIALQINNWSEAKKAREFEVKMLLEIKTALEQDYQFWNEYLPVRNDAHKVALAYFENYLRTGEIELEAASEKFRRFRGYWRGQFITGPFEALKSTGFDKLSNDQLRSQLVYHYDFFCPQQISKTLAYIDARMDTYKELDSRLMGPGSVVLKDEGLDFPGQQLVTLDLENNPDFVEALRNIWSRVNFSERMFQETVIEIHKMIELINEEIKDEI